MTDDVPSVVLGGLPVPASIVTAMLARRWIFPAEPTGLEQIFGMVPTPQATLYSLAGMLGENASWWSADPEEHALYGAADAPSPGESHHVVRPSRTLLIGDLGHDLPIALEYPGQPGESGKPRVVCLLGGAPGWREVAPSAEAFLSALAGREPA